MNILGLQIGQPGTGKRRAPDEITRLQKELTQQRRTFASKERRLQQVIADRNGVIIRQRADLARLRQALIQARPRIHIVPSQMVRPYAPEVVLPFVPPVPPADTTAEETQELAVLDLPLSARVAAGVAVTVTGGPAS